MTTETSQRADAGMAAFVSTTSRWGRITMTTALLLSLAGPVHLVAFTGVEVGGAQIWIAFAAVAATFGVIWVLEPLTYYPILGPAAMYQAFMIGNISNKLLPAAIVAQDSVNAAPGTRRGDLAAVMAICGAAVVHLTSLLVFVGLLGNWLLSILPAELIEVARLYILPAVLGAVLVQCVATMRRPRPTVIAVVAALLIQFALIPVLPGLAMYATALCVATTMALSWFLRDRRPPGEALQEGDTDPVPSDPHTQPAKEGR
ncbi:hypothetical protein [Nocardiopsis ganjiahuensis]|uniref:hypothetical protein n=1 Tax=Nocardiopsis ganjiahuensis TaxID=239984 RepID=UPI00034C9D41|nr:hypothetical protein [Nocardiopsis ganjiahuensis]